MADRDAEPARAGAGASRPVGEVPGRRPTQMETLRTGLLGDLGAEFLGTFVLIAFGDGVVAMAVAGLNQSGRGKMIFDASGDWLLITWGWAIAVTMGVYVAGGGTGAHLNPPVTLALAVRRAFPGGRVPAYWLAQVLGAFVGAALVFIVYSAAIGSWEQANHVTRGSLGSFVTYSIFATFPAPYFLGNPIWPLIDQIVGTAFLLMFISALIDRRNLAPKANHTPWLVGLGLSAIGMSYGANAGYAINPARELGPRLFAWVAGWGRVALPGTYHSAGLNFSGYFWIPIVGPLIGAVIGILLYDLF